MPAELMDFDKEKAESKGEIRAKASSAELENPLISQVLTLIGAGVPEIGVKAHHLIITFHVIWSK